jgi:hypothetical protein
MRFPISLFMRRTENARLALVGGRAIFFVKGLMQCVHRYSANGFGGYLACIPRGTMFATSLPSGSEFR